MQTFQDETVLHPGPRHLVPGQTYNQYNSNPPTSGRHDPRAAPWGVSEQPVPKEVAVHNLEHGGVVAWYNCAAGPQPLDGAACQQLRDRLAQVVQQALDEGKMVLMTPYSEMPQRIALTAWQTLDAFDEFDQARVATFIGVFECRFDIEGFCR